jgi:hypothetical protein
LKEEGSGLCWEGRDVLHGHLSFWTVGGGLPRTRRLLPSHEHNLLFDPFTVSHLCPIWLKTRFGDARYASAAVSSEAELQLPCHEPNMQKILDPKISQPQAFRLVFSYPKTGVQRLAKYTEAFFWVMPSQPRNPLFTAFEEIG